MSERINNPFDPIEPDHKNTSPVIIPKLKLPISCSQTGKAAIADVEHETPSHWVKKDKQKTKSEEEKEAMESTVPQLKGLDGEIPADLDSSEEEYLLHYGEAGNEDEDSESHFEDEETGAHFRFEELFLKLRSLK